MNLEGINKNLIVEDWERVVDVIYLQEDEERYKQEIEEWIRNEEATIEALDLNGNIYEITKTGELIQNWI